MEIKRLSFVNMYRFVVLFIAACSSIIALPAQNLTGIWRGFFIQKNYNPFSGQFVEDRYKYEVQINELPNKALEGVTYSYKTTVFYGKAAFKGLFTPSTKNIIIKETKMLEIKASDLSVPCLMTCYLDYSKDGKQQILSGTFSSIGEKDKNDCGSGTVYLMKVAESDFEPAPFLKQNPQVKQNNNSDLPTGNTADIANKNIQKIQQALGLTPDGKWGPKSKAALMSKLPQFQGELNFANTNAINAIIQQIENINKSNSPKKQTQPNLAIQPKPNELKLNLIDTTHPETKKEVTLPPPAEITTRKNKLVKEIFVNAADVKIDFYDNGVIDNDSITVFDNNKLVVNHARLSEKPITINLHLSTEAPTHEIITYANNLGDVPPNTALMVITAGNERHEIFITSDESNNAKVIITYKPKTVQVQRTY
ncbi:hypothetical protein LX80_00416 [Hydrotalea sandarakina]|jgi:hypothetical protein|uniref:Peptidoglycan binding protein n=2 Tax=Hydrotalea sandarakina TaxID=1004304 RepID=A0A2W7TS36_9BACT|nr:hypothetical protein LX80_00416 [Hydrotalea sandarakina]